MSEGFAMFLTIVGVLGMLFITIILPQIKREDEEYKDDDDDTMQG